MIAPTVSARIAEPSLSDLVQHSSNIVTGRVVAVLPTPFSPYLLIALILLGAFVAARTPWRQQRHGAAIGRAIGILTLGLIGLLTLASVTTHSAYQNVALVHVQQTHRGATGSIVPVFFGTSFICDVSDLDRGQRYVFFLNESVIGYQPTWYDWSFWSATETGVQAKRLRWANQPSIPYADFIEALKDAGVTTPRHSHSRT